MATAAAQGGSDKPALRKPVFTKVDQLKPGTNGHTLTVKVVSATPVPGRARPGAPAAASSRAPRIAECLVGDETGVIVFTARNDQGVSMFVLLSPSLYRLLLSSAVDDLPLLSDDATEEDGNINKILLCLLVMTI
jgi:replication factor A1